MDIFVKMKRFFVFVDCAMCWGAVLRRIGRDDDESSAEARRDEWAGGRQRGDDQEEAAHVPQPDQAGHRLLQPTGQSLQGEHPVRPSVDGNAILHVITYIERITLSNV